MRLLLALMILGMVGCSSKVKKDETDLSQISNTSFKKDKALSSREVPDYYPQNTQTLNPAMQDETLDRYSKEELSALSDNQDSLLVLSLFCTRKEFDKAFNLAAKMFDRYQKIPAYWNQVANCHLNQGSDKKALLFYNKALEVSPSYVPALNNIGVLYSRQGQDQKAIVAFERAHSHSKFSKTPRYNLAKTYLTYGLAAEALPLFQGLLSEAPNDVDLLNAVGSSHFLLSDYPRAWSYFQKIPQNLWGRPEIGLNLAVTLNNINRQSDALKVFNGISKPSKEELVRYYSSVANHLGVK